MPKKEIAFFREDDKMLLFNNGALFWERYGTVVLISLTFFSVIWGIATYAVHRSKGYESNWFWFGFFCGIIAFIVALAKPSKHDSDLRDYSEDSDLLDDSVPLDEHDREILEYGGWRCSCGKVNFYDTEICECGRTKQALNDTNKTKNTSVVSGDLSQIRTLKELYDSGAITQEEFDAKKKQILGL